MHESISFNPGFLRLLQVFIFENNCSQWNLETKSISKGNLKLGWNEKLHTVYITSCFIILKKLSEIESLNRRGQIIKIQQQQRKRRYQIADLTFNNGNSQRDECLSDKDQVSSSPFPSIQCLSLEPCTCQASALPLSYIYPQPSN